MARHVAVLVAALNISWRSLDHLLQPAVPGPDVSARLAIIDSSCGIELRLSRKRGSCNEEVALIYDTSLI